MLIEKTRGIPLTRRNFKEAHAFLMIFTEKRGLVPTVGYGISHFGSRRASHLDMLNVCELELQHRKGVWAVNHCKTLEPHLKVKNNLEKSYLAMLTAGKITASMPIEAPQEKVFQLLLDYMTMLGDAEDIEFSSLEVLSLLAQIKALSLLGHFPMLSEHTCPHASAESYSISFEPFQIQCTKCDPKGTPTLRQSLHELLMRCENQSLLELSTDLLNEDPLPLESLVAHFEPT